MILSRALGLIVLLSAAFLLTTVVSCGGDGDDDDDAAPSADDVSDDEDDEDTDDSADDTGADDTGDDTSDVEYPGPPWFGCTDEDIPADATVVTALDAEDQYYNGDSDNRRTVDGLAEFPEGDWSSVTMRVELDCPEDGNCDNWDRFANLALVFEEDTPEETELEIWRYITPYNIGMCMLADVSAFAPMLAGSVPIRSFIDTWVGPESPGTYGHGWRTTVKFIFHPAKADGIPTQVINLRPHAAVELGNPDNPISDQLIEVVETLPEVVSKAELRVLITGHGQGNLDNCGEFCHLKQVLLVNGAEYSFDPWRSDCDENPIGPLQAGTWEYNRAGWCPGAAVVPQVFDITGDITPGTENTFSYQIQTGEGETYENTCRPGAGDADNYCEGCVFSDASGNCDYDGGLHTQPNDRIAVQLFLWE